MQKFNLGGHCPAPLACVSDYWTTGDDKKGLDN